MDFARPLFAQAYPNTPSLSSPLFETLRSNCWKDIDATSQATNQFGTQLHKLLQGHVQQIKQGTVPTKDDFMKRLPNAEYKPAADVLWDWLQSSKYTFLDTEIPVSADEYQGKVDLLVKSNASNQLMILDLKVKKNQFMNSEYGMQVAAYVSAFNSQQMKAGNGGKLVVEGGAVVILDKTSLKITEHVVDLDLFTKLFSLQLNIKNSKPRDEDIYQLIRV